jgi:hypothetical protein
MDQAIPRLVGDIASSRAEDIVSFAQKHSQRECFCAKEKSVPRCRRRLHRYREETARLNAHRVTPVKESSFSETCCAKHNMFLKKTEHYHAAAGAAGAQGWHKAGTSRSA